MAVSTVGAGEDTFSSSPPPQSPAGLAALRRLVEPLAIRGRSKGVRQSYGFDYGHGEGEKYHGVFPHKSGYRGQIKFLGRQIKTATRATAFEAAVELARWYQRVFGPDWGEWFTGKTKFYPGAHLPWQVRRSESRRGYVAAVWVAGKREEVVCLRKEGDTWKPTNRLATFRSEARAIEYLFVWLVRLYGQFAPLLLWRRRASSPFAGG